MIEAMLFGVAYAASPAGLVAARSSVVVVRQGASTCAGVLLDDGSIATAYHCIAGGFGARVTFPDRERGRARVVAADPARDLALLTTGDRRGPGLALGPAPRVGDEVAVIGHPYASSAPGGFLEGTLRWSVGYGRIAAVGSRSLQLDVTVGPGNSGGPVVDAEGRVIGIVSRRIGDGVGFAGRAERLAELRDAPRRRPLGGTITGALAGWVGGRPVIGVDLEVTWRERLVVGARGGLPVAPYVRAVAGDDVEATVALARGGVRLPLGAGPGAMGLDGFGAMGLAQTWASPDGGPPRTDLRIDPLLGVGISRSGLAVDAAFRLGASGAQPPWLLGLRVGVAALRRFW